jgi:hypothetical protein
LLSLCHATTARLQAVDAELIDSSPYQAGIRLETVAL